VVQAGDPRLGDLLHCHREVVLDPPAAENQLMSTIRRIIFESVWFLASKRCYKIYNFLENEEKNIFSTS
jgi:hypothetical protein